MCSEKTVSTIFFALSAIVWLFLLYGSYLMIFIKPPSQFQTNNSSVWEYGDYILIESETDNLTLTLNFVTPTFKFINNDTEIEIKNEVFYVADNKDSSVIKNGDFFKLDFPIECVERRLGSDCIQYSYVIHKKTGVKFLYISRK